MNSVKIIDVSPRDGLQNDPRLATVEEKRKLIELLVEAGIKDVEATSFVHPLKVPQMADASKVLDAITDLEDLKTIALVPNIKGYERAHYHKLTEVNWVSSATETFNQKNIGQSVDENLRQYQTLTAKAKEDGINTCFSIAVSFGCPYEGNVSEDNVLRLVEKVKKAGADRIGIADTIGIAVPDQVERVMKRVINLVGNTPVTIHLHDTRGLGSANAYAAYQAGVRVFETSASGIGGCPFAPGAAGNLATEDLVYLFHRMNIETGVDFDRLLIAADYAANLSTKNPLGRIRHVENQNKRGNLV